ncbi:Protein CBR-HPO-11 [Caenorhabditis briggsae]|uniref:Protein CBR-HPO-11 n=1 Tax=Caenorhabditis briggsae TaxID=6238 RepID=A8XXY9_CAEBR|nr:Protein CBR-HPO-11 [Caenorhabditis briggsae]CAP37508.2 Protein CBR-HPO-11 [Caenorhabditis briggsae]
MVSSGEDRAAAGKSAPPGDDVASDSDADGAEEILEESPDKRWSKRREQVKQRDVPGIDVAYLAMDNETGNEVVWNEVQFSERKNFRAQEEKINAVFDNLTQLVHTNLVKFHKYWTDSKSEKPRIIFITEYMSSGSMSAFLQRTRKAGSPLSIKAWKKWTTQILSALNYLHSSDPPIIHGNLTCNTVFIQQNGLIKIGCVAPDAINHHVKTCRENMRYMHYIAPEYEILDNTELTSAADIYSFGICSLEIAVIGGLSGCQNGSSEGPVTEDVIEKAIRSLEDPMQQDFIRQCLRKDPAERPSARELLFHQILFEVHSLKLLSAHSIVDSKKYEDVPESAFRIKDNEQIAATSKLREMAYCQVAAFQVDLEKFLDDVRNGIYPLTAFAPLAHQPSTTLRAYSNTNPPTLLTSDTLSAPSSTHPSANTTITAETTAVASAALQLNVSGTTVNGNGSTSQSSIYKATLDSAGVERAISEAFEIRAARQAEVQQQEDENDTSLREPNPDDPLPPQSSSTAPPVENGTLTTSLISTPTSISKMNPSPLVLPPPQATSTPTPAPLPSKPTTMTMTSSDASAVTSSSKTS